MHKSLTAFVRKFKFNTSKVHVSQEQVQPQNYFQLARNWSDDMFAAVEVSRNRWRAASIYGFIPLTFLLLISMLFLIPVQHIEPLLINHYENGLVTVQPLQHKYMPSNRAQVESDIVRYVINRESYSAASYHEQYKLINLLSNSTVAKHYRAQQDSSNKLASINILGDHGTRKVHVESVVFLDRADTAEKHKHSQIHRNLAQVNYSVTDTDNNSAKRKKQYLTALVSWDYQGTPNDPEEMWRDWDGFKVTHFSVSQRLV